MMILLVLPMPCWRFVPKKCGLPLTSPLCFCICRITTTLNKLRPMQRCILASEEARDRSLSLLQRGHSNSQSGRQGYYESSSFCHRETEFRDASGRSRPDFQGLQKQGASCGNRARQVFNHSPGTEKKRWFIGRMVSSRKTYPVGAGVSSHPGTPFRSRDSAGRLDWLHRSKSHSARKIDRRTDHLQL